MPADLKIKVPLGRTGLQVGRLGIAAAYGAETASIEKAFHEYGINYFVLGGRKNSGMHAAVRNIARENREGMVIGYQVFDPVGWFIKGRTEKILKKLELDYVDVLILSWYNRGPSKRILDKVYDLKARGRIRFIGMSGHNRKTFGRLAQEPGCPIDVFMIRYNVVNSGAEQDIFPYLGKEKRPGITTYTATCWRKLLDPKKMSSGEKPLSAADCYRFVLSNPNVDVCLTGPANGEQLTRNIKALERGLLSDEEMARIRRIGAFIYKS